MAEALRRLLWLAPLLAVASWVLFALFSWGTPAAPERADLPLFFNESPQGLRQRVTDAVEELVQGESPAAAQRLASLGGAALPLVLPQLEQHDPAAQRRLAVALLPVARRAGVAPEDLVFADPADAVAFWSRFWRERSLDFQPTVVARLVRRVGARSLALGGTDLLQLDTYALPELVSQLGKVKTQEDVARVRRLLRIISSITEQRWLVAPDASPDAARRAVTECRRWWDDQRDHYTDVSGLRRITATVFQTQYGRWALRSLRELMGLDSSTVGETLLQRARISGTLLLFCILGATLVATLAAAAVSALHFLPARVLRLVGAAGVALVMPAMVLWPPHPSSAGALTNAAILSVVLGAIPAFHLNQRMLQALPTTPRDSAYVPRFARLAGEALRATPLWAPLAFGESLTLVFALEWSSGLPGVGSLTVTALKTGDVPWLMALCLSLGALTALVQILADAAVQAERAARLRRSAA